jgi:hypothetical protein
MTATKAAFGMLPVRHLNGGAGVQIEERTIASGLADPLYKGSPVRLAADGTVEACQNTERGCGVFLGVTYETDAAGIVISNYWPASTTLKSGTTAKAKITLDPGIIYIVQADGALSLAELGNCADWVATGADGYDDGNATTQTSEAMLDASTASTTTAQLQILGLHNIPDNALTDTYPIVEVLIAEHQLQGSTSAGTGT